MSVTKDLTLLSINLTSNKVVLLTITVLVLSFVLSGANFAGDSDENQAQDDLDKLVIEKVDVDIKEQKCFGFARRFFPRRYRTTFAPGNPLIISNDSLPIH